MMQAIGVFLLPFQLQRPLQPNTDEELQVVGQTSHQGEELLSNPELSDAGLLGFRKQGEKCDDLLAEKFRFAAIGEI